MGARKEKWWGKSLMRKKTPILIMFRFFLRKFRKKKEKGWILDTFL